MDESFLLEQLIKMREMSERMSAARIRAAELPGQLERDRDVMRQNPLSDVRDFRIDQTYDPLEAPRQYSSHAPRSSTRRRRRP